MQRRTWLFGIGAMTAAAGCAAIAGIEETTTIEPDGAEASTGGDAPSDAGSIVDGEDFVETPDVEAPPVDAALCADAAARIKGTDAAVVETANGVACGYPKDVLVADEGRSVNLDYDPEVGGLATRWEGDRPVHGCIGVEFDGGVTAVVVRARMVADGCGNSCVGEGCNTFHYFGAWLRQPDGGMHFLAGPQIRRNEYTESVVLLADGGEVQDPFVAICRTSLALYRDDIDVDYVGGCR